MILAWLRRRRRQKLLSTPFPPEWAAVIARNVAMYQRLAEADRVLLCDIARVLVAEKNWEGCGGLVMTDEIRVTISVQAARLLLGLRHDYFARVQSILVYPAGFRSPDGWQSPDGVIDPTVGAVGQAWYDGPVILAWDSVLEGGRNPDDGHNVVLHEFAHQLDYLDGMADGTPPLSRNEDYARWQQVMTYEFTRLKVESESGKPKVLDRYGATNPAEFFAVATETFFEKPAQMKERHPDLYAVLREYYHQDPAGEPGVSIANRGRSPVRKSRRAAPPTLNEVLESYPRWVLFWEIHPGVSRAQALAPQESQLSFTVSFGVMSGLFAGLWGAHFPPYRATAVISGLLSAALLCCWIWLRLAVRWVDRNGVWGGERKPPAPPEGPSPPNVAGGRDSGH